MKPAEFLKVALVLSVRPSEAERRTAVGRAYYAAYHLALQMLEREFGVVVPVHESHVKVGNCLRSIADVDEARDAGRLLHFLRQARRIADYELDNLSPGQPSWATVHLRQAQELIDLLDLCAKEPLRSRLASSIRNYAQNLLGWSLRDV